MPELTATGERVLVDYRRCRHCGCVAPAMRFDQPGCHRGRCPHCGRATRGRRVEVLAPTGWVPPRPGVEHKAGAA